VPSELVVEVHHPVDARDPGVPDVTIDLPSEARELRGLAYHLFHGFLRLFRTRHGRGRGLPPA